MYSQAVYLYYISNSYLYILWQKENKGRNDLLMMYVINDRIINQQDIDTRLLFCVPCDNICFQR